MMGKQNSRTKSVNANQKPTCQMWISANHRRHSVFILITLGVEYHTLD